MTVSKGVIINKYYFSTILYLYMHVKQFLNILLLYMYLSTLKDF